MKNFLENSIQILDRTPGVLNAMLSDISPEWHQQNEVSETWSPFDIVGHLIHGEKTDWIPRMNIILSPKKKKKFQPYDRFAQFEESKGKNLSGLLLEFSSIRMTNIKILKEKKLTTEDLEKKGIHPDFGHVNLRQLLSAWVVHDLNHIAQISRVMAKQYEHEVGPWRKYLKILNS